MQVFISFSLCISLFYVLHVSNFRLYILVYCYILLFIIIMHYG